MLKSVKLHDIGPVHNLSARFGERLNVLTGDNGLGKSFLLDIAFWTLTGSWPGFRVALPENSRSKVRPVIERRYTLGHVPDAVRHIEEGHTLGKLVITVEPT